MSTYAIDVSAPDDIAPVRDVTTDLDGQTFRLVLTWRARQARWYLDLYASDGTALAKGVGLNPGTPVLGRRRGGQWPGGAFILSAIDGGTGPATMDGLGVTHELVYIDAEWWALVQADAAAAALTVI